MHLGAIHIVDWLHGYMVISNRKCLKAHPNMEPIVSRFRYKWFHKPQILNLIVDETPVGRFSMAEEESRRNVEITRENFTAPDARILVVDDVDLNLAVFKQLLKNSGMTIETASTGARSLEMIGSGNYDIVFMDYLMPEMDGIETMRKGRDEGIIDTEKFPVIALTADAVSGAREMFLNEGFSDYLTKPIQIKQLIEMFIKYLPDDKVIPSVR